jgi:hypothetical protein
VEAGLALAPLDQKALIILVLVVLLWWFLRHVCKMFNEILVNEKVLSWFRL